MEQRVSEVSAYHQAKPQLRRLRRIEGQVRGAYRIVEDGRP